MKNRQTIFKYHELISKSEQELIDMMCDGDYPMVTRELAEQTFKNL